MAEYPASDALIPQIAAGKGVADKAGFLELKHDCERWKADDYDAYQLALRHYYEGKIAGHVMLAAALRFRHTAKRMALVEYNWARLYAHNAAAVYDDTPQRFLSRDGDRLDPDVIDQIEDEADEGPEAADGDEAKPTEPSISPDDVQRCEDFAEMVKEALLDKTLAEAERRVSLARTVFLRVYSDSLTAIATGKPDEPVTRVQCFWPSDVLVLPHPRCPTSLTTALAVLLRVSGEDGVRGGSTTWEVWTRPYEEDAAGNVTSFGPWLVERVTETRETFRDAWGNEQVETKIDVTPIQWRTPGGGISATYPLPTLPIVEWHDGISDGCPFLDVDRNLLGVFNTINVSLMAEQFAVDFCAATPIVRISSDTLNANIAMGPGMMTRIPAGDQVVPVPVGADFAGIRAATQALADTLALTSRQSPSSYNAENSQAPTSGVALKIKNEAQIKARREKVARAVEMEHRLLAVMIEVHDFWRGTSIADDGICAEMQPADVPDYEDRAITQRRAIDARDAGLISDAECRVLCGYSPTLEDARAQIANIEAAKKLDPARANLLAAAGLNKQERLEAQANGLPGGDPSALPATTTTAPLATVKGSPAPTAHPLAQAAVDGTVQDTALNGAQVASLVDVVTKIADGTLPRETAQAIILAAFPAMTPEQVARIVDPVKEGSDVAAPAPPPPAPPKRPPVPPGR